MAREREEVAMGGGSCRYIWEAELVQSWKTLWRICRLARDPKNVIYLLE